MGLVAPAVGLVGGCRRVCRWTFLTRSDECSEYFRDRTTIFQRCQADISTPAVDPSHPANCVDGVEAQQLREQSVAATQPRPQHKIVPHQPKKLRNEN
jgi:hypothetical protein